MADQHASAKPMPHAADGTVGEHGSMDDHGGDHGHDDHNMGEGHAMTALGPIDVTAWGAAILGIVLGIAVALAFLAAAS